MNALLGYGSSSEESGSENGEENIKNTESGEINKETEKLKLPKPVLDESSLHTSVFKNPFVQAEKAKSDLLEKHVKMVPGKEETQMINGKKICWNFRKGRCRFGHNCKYAHDSDIQKSAEELEADKQKYKSVVCESSGTLMNNLPPEVEIDNKINPTDDTVWEGGIRKKKKRPGLSTGLVPSQKVIKMYKQQKINNTISKQ
ncbi:zinc finger CCCH domain-containing protein 8 [Leptidea sinapis]|uniref:C3H1-type domain-containing protein n=1 Tax=Leptidea sinapis TaxID=189913 RepID=A0A5E4PWD3_9NEOP|nr:zinc finger CCCH domain-containing protein 8 [Leptidea sinapis]XP_050666360.1 zinc finger CCCH domain-containing protein 8 [Leptidea sinapis]VVC89742.1 unnamed protein product [Leptidea sinapis]